MKKLALTSLLMTVLVTALVTTTISAANLRKFFGRDKDELTTEQQAVVDEYEKELKDLQSRFLDKAVESGIITEEEAKTQEEFITNGKMGRAGSHGSRSGKNSNLIDSTKLESLTDEQKAKINELKYEQVATEKSFTQKFIEAGIITRAQADALLERYTDNSNDKIRFHIGGIDMFTKWSNLTTEQQTVVDEYKVAIKNITTKQIDLYAEYGVITAETAQTLKENAESDKSFGIKFEKGNSKKETSESNTSMKPDKDKAQIVL